MFSTQDPRPKYIAKILKENFEREHRSYKIYEVFNPSFKNPTLAGKFYSRNDILDMSIAEPDLVARINWYREGVPKQKYPEPITGNQVYGWVSQLLVPLNKGDTRYYAPRNATVSKINVTLKKNK